jgi:hypothetical protein
MCVAGSVHLRLHQIEIALRAQAHRKLARIGAGGEFR